MSSGPARDAKIGGAMSRLDDKHQAMIQAVLNTLRSVDWTFSSHTKDEYVSLAYLFYRGKTAGGRWMELQAVAPALLSGGAFLRMTTEERDAMRKDAWLQGLTALLHRQLTTRQGYRGHRGRFRVVAIHPRSDLTHVATGQ